jgi:RNA-directed DNA polymerase
MVRSLKHLYYLLNTDKEELNEILNNLDNYYYSYSIQKKNEDGTPKVKHGRIEKREFCPSIGRLKEIQNRIKLKILRNIPMPSYIQGGVKGKDNISNALYHKGNKYFFTTDIRNFFPSIKFDYVYKMFLRYNFSYDVSSVITKLTTYKYSVPQGIPTSTYITNLVFIPLDQEIMKLCSQENIKYTRFVDDLSFSSKNDFQNLITEIINKIYLYQLKISHKKTKYKIGPTEITGILVKNNLIKPAKKILQRLNISNDIEYNRNLKTYIDRIDRLSSKNKSKNHFR